MRNFGQAMAVSDVQLLTALLQRHLEVLTISSIVVKVVRNLKWRVVGRLRHTFSSLHNLI